MANKKTGSPLPKLEGWTISSQAINRVQSMMPSNAKSDSIPYRKWTRNWPERVRALPIFASTSRDRASTFHPIYLVSLGRVSKLMVAERATRMRALNQELMEYLNDVGRDSGICH